MHVIDGRYHVEQALGRGGEATAYRVIDESSGRPLALKQLRSRHEGDRLRFRREFHTMARLVHPCVVEVFDFGITPDGPYYTMELLEGPDLKKLAPLEPIAACRILRDIASALAFLHARGLVHRDVTPGNVRCTSDGRAKLIDFGIITTSGSAGEVAGTPPFMAPEVLRGTSVDAGADLFGLGSLAYWLLTGSYAYDARTVQELEHVWASDVMRPSLRAPETPASLDALVMSLLGIERLARPGSAAEVVDRLGAIGGLARDPDLAVVSGYLASATLIGRDAELARVRRRIRRLGTGQGGAVTISAPSGTGKSRLLREAALEAQLAGATVARVVCQPSPGPYAAIRALARELLAAAPEDAVAAAREHADVLGRAVPELRARLDTRAAKPAGDPREDRLEIQDHLLRWLLAVAERRRLVLVVDDVQRCDDASAAVIAAVAHSAVARTILILAGLRSDEAPAARDSIASLQTASTRMTLGGLSEGQTEALARSLFGDVHRLAHLARWLHERSSGSPLHIVELARHLADTNVVRFVDGVWVIPETFGDALPQSLTLAADHHVAALPAAARALAEVLAIHGGEIPLERAQRLAQLTDEQLLEQLDTLEYTGIIERVGGGHRFRHDALREAVLRGIDAQRRRTLHLAVGQLLAARLAPDTEAEVGWHLLRGGQRSQGAKLLDRAATKLYDAQSFVDAIPLLEAVHEVYRSDGASPGERLRIQHMLVSSGAMVNRAVAVKYAPSTIAEYAHYAGIDRARRHGRFVGRPLGLVSGIAGAWPRWLVASAAGSVPNPVEAARNCVYAMTAVAPVYSTSYQIDELERLVRDAEILSIAKDRIPHGAYLFMSALLDYVLGNWQSMRTKLMRTIELSHTDQRTPIRDVDRALGLSGAHGVIAIERMTEHWPEEHVAAMQRVPLRITEAAIAQIRIGWHRFRGEEDDARRVEAEAAPLFVQLGLLWANEAWMAEHSARAYALNHDLMGLRRSIARLQQMIDIGCNHHGFIDVARADYHRELGQLDRARELAESVLARLPERERFVRQHAMIALARTLVAQGQPHLARPLALKVRDIARDPAHGKHYQLLAAEELLARCDAADGNLDAAVARAAAAVIAAERVGIPGLTGLMHELRAQLALAAGDRTSFEHHVVAMKRWLTPTRNPALIARIDHLLGTAALANARPGADTSEALTVRAGSTSGLAEDVASRALASLIAAAGASAGYLYVMRSDGRLELSAPIDTEEPDDSIVEGLRELFDPDLVDSLADATVVERPETWRAVALRRRDGHHTIDIGGVLLRRGDRPLQVPSAALCDDVAEELRARLGVGHQLRRPT